MIWKNGLTKNEKYRLKTIKTQTWHKWFAWYPVVIWIKEGHQIKAWLQYLERRSNYVNFPNW
jgi:hypothetical protein